MKYKYRSLSILATTLKVFGWIVLASGVALTIFLLASSPSSRSFLNAFLVFLITIIYAVIFLAVGDFYHLMIDLEKHVRGIEKNTRFLEEKENK